MVNNLHISLRIFHTESLLKAKPGVYFSHEDLRDYWFAQTGIRLELSHVPGVLTRIQSNGLTAIHCKGDSVCFETEEIRSQRIARETIIKEGKLNDRAHRDYVVWAKKRDKVSALLEQLQEARKDLRAFEDSHQDSILRVV